MYGLTFSFRIYLFLFILLTFTVKAQRDPITEAVIEQRLLQIDSGSVIQFKQATIALDSSNYTIADSLFTLVLKNAPSFDAALRRSGSVKIALGQTNEGIALCKKALAVERSYAKLYSLAATFYFATAKNNTNTPELLSEAISLLPEIKTVAGANESEYLNLAAQLYYDYGNEEAFKRVTKELLQKYPKLVSSHYFGAIAAAMQEEWTKAEDEIQLSHPKITIRCCFRYA